MRAHVVLMDSSPTADEEHTPKHATPVQKSVTSWRERQARKREGQSTLKEGIKKEDVPCAILMHGRATALEHGKRSVLAKDIHKFDNESALQLGHPISIKDGNFQLIGWGVFNPNTSHQIRIMQTVGEIPLAEDCVLKMRPLLEARIGEAVELRKMLALPSDETNVYRLINSDGDRLPGLLVDIYNEFVVVTSTAAWVEEFQSDIVDVLRKETGIEAILWRPDPAALLQEGVPNSGSKLLSPAKQVTMPSTILVREQGAKMHLCLEEKDSGFQIDQRDSRLLIRSLSKDLRVLDLCCCAGGFGINAAMGGAKEVVGIDFPGTGIEQAEKNAAENGVDDVCKFIAGNVASFMTVSSENGDLWDLVILNPPNLAPEGSNPQVAETRYRKINKAASRLVKPGGLLLTSTRSSELVVSGQFGPIVQSSVITSGRHPAFLQQTGSAKDHTLDYSNADSNALSNLLLAIQ